MALLATALACLAMHPGCGGPAVATSPPPPSVAQFAVAYQRSGGLKAEPRSLRITRGRHATAKGGGNAVRFRVGVRKIRRVRRGLESANIESVPAPVPQSSVTCADCFHYRITYRGHVAEFSQEDQPRQLVPVVNELEALIDSHLPFH
ncbi:MAG TPA: hypothetical protein VH476_10640 [Solirubrobacterales bacterium]